MRRALLLCGLLSSLVYVAADAVGALSYAGYDYTSQAISEMSAVGAPTARMLVPFYFAYSLLLAAFGLGVRRAAGSARMRAAGLLLAAVGLLGVIVWPFFPMHARGAERSFTDTVHLAMGGIDVLFLSLAFALASGAFGKGFRIYSWATIAAMLAFGAATSLYVPRVDAGLPTPGLGIVERLIFVAYLSWIAVLSVKLLRREVAAPGETLRRPA